MHSRTTQRVAGECGLLCFGGEDWWYHNHGHIDIQLMKRFQQVMPVLYVNSIVMRRPCVREGRMFWTRLGRKTRSILRGAREVLPGLHVYSPASLPVHHRRAGRALNQRLVAAQVGWQVGRLLSPRPAVWVACPAACDVALSISRSVLAYQRSDIWENYPGVDREQIAAYDRRLKAAADVTFFVNHKMMREETSQCRKAVFLDHGVDFERFATAAQSPFVPPEMRGLSRPIIGFFGDLDGGIVDLDLICDVVDRLRDRRFVFVGGNSLGTAWLAGRPNVTLIPRRPYEMIAHYGKCFDVALMPWQQNDWIDRCNPVKLKEYLALGKPVVSTPFSELDQYDGQVYRAAGADAFAEAIRLALAEDSTERARARQEWVRGASWESRARLALESLGIGEGQ